MTDLDPHAQFKGVKPVEERHQLDEAALTKWLEANVEGFRGPLTINQFKGGQSNPTYQLVTPTKKYVVDYSITELEQRLDPKDFVRIHRSILLNTNYVQEIHQWFAGRVLVRLKDEKRTELTVARDRVRALKDRLSF